ncbi:MAG: hypothetical protein D6768_17870 [Chloroflexi bacterium]|nr:MAG: hypothetical protein D6768_17870 [Chloroflexota bacterium]
MTLDFETVIPLVTGAPAGDGRLDGPENWYAEPFTKRTACRTPGQCGGDCDCGCPYNTMTELERLPLIEDVAAVFPNEWLAFIISPEEDDDLEPLHGKLVAHSPNPDEVYDAVNTVLWNQHIYIFFNGDFESLQASYGAEWSAEPPAPEQRTYSGPKQAAEAAAGLAAQPALPDDVLGLVYSAVDQLYGQPNLNEAIRRLRLSRVRAARAEDPALLPVIDSALDQLETALPRVNEVTWFLEEALAEIEQNEQ